MINILAMKRDYEGVEREIKRKREDAKTSEMILKEM